MVVCFFCFVLLTWLTERLGTLFYTWLLLVWCLFKLLRPAHGVLSVFWAVCFHVSLGAGCCDALIQSSTLQNNWPGVEQGPLFWQPLPAVSQHITLPLGGQKRAISAFLDPGDSLFAELTLANNNTKSAELSLVITWICIEVEIRWSKMGNNQRVTAAEAVKTACACGELTQYHGHFLLLRFHVA